MNVSGTRWVPLIALSMLTPYSGVLAQSSSVPASLSAPASSRVPTARLQPISSPSAVDRYRGPVQSAYDHNLRPQPGSNLGRSQVQSVVAHGSDGGGLRQIVRQQQFTAPQLPPASSGGFSPPPTTSQPSLPANPAMTPRSLPANPDLGSGGNLMPVPQDQSILVPRGADLAPLAQPELSNGYATIDNCNCVTAPSGYSTASVIEGCAPVSYQVPAYPATAYPPQTYQTPVTYAVTPTAAPVVLPNGFAAPQLGGAPAGALVTFGQESYPVQVGQGWWGQPVAYVPGQRFRNWLRYIFP